MNRDEIFEEDMAHEAWEDQWEAAIDAQEMVRRGEG